MHALVLGMVVCLTCVHGATAQPSGRQVARVINVEVIESGTIITIGLGSNQGFDRRAKATLVIDKDATAVVPGAEVVLIRVDRRTMLGRTHATVAQVQAHPWVLVESQP